MSLKRNLVANYLGQAWTGLIGLAFVPLYIRYLGIESYGLIGVFTLLQTWFLVLDMGLTPALGREMARFTAGAHSVQSIRDLLRSIEWLGVGIALFIGMTIWVGSAWLATHWLQASALPPAAVAQAVALMGAVIGLRFLESVYRGALLGLQRQVLANAAGSLFATLRAAGAVAVLAWWSPTIAAYFFWQAGVGVLATAGFAWAVHRGLPPALAPPRFSRQALIEVRHFAGGMLLTTLLALLLTQVDKLLLSRLLSLADFGYYTLAATVAGAVYLMVTPISQSFYPRLTELVTRHDETGLIRTYHQGARLVTLIAAPGALMLVAFGEELLLLWTGDAGLASRAAPLLSLLAGGTLLNGLMHMPYMLQLAHGWTGFAVRINVVAVALLVPAIFWVVPHYGAMGAAWAWVLLNAGYVGIGVFFMHRRLLPTEKWRWYRDDLLKPALLIGGYVLFARWWMPIGLGRWEAVPWLAAICGLGALGFWIAIRHMQETICGK